MKILYFSPHPNLNFGAPSGPGTHMREMVHAFKELGHEVELCILGGTEWSNTAGPVFSGGWKQRLKPFIPSLLWHTLKDRNLLQFDAHAADELQKACDAFQPDIIYERGYYLMTSGITVARENGIRHILEINAPYPEEKVEMEGKSLLHKRAIAAERAQFESTQRVVVVSHALREYAIERGAAPEKVVVTPNAVRNTQVIPDQEAAAAIRERWAIPSDALVFGFVGSIFPYHGVDRLIDAFEAPELSAAHLLIVGGGAWLEELRERARLATAAGRIHFTDNVPHEQVAWHIAAMDVTVMGKSNWYGSPVKIFEYGVFGKPIVAPDVGPVRDVMTHGENGLLVPLEGPELGAAMVQLAQDPALRSRLGTAFQVKIQAEHSWVHMARKVLA